MMTGSQYRDSLADGRVVFHDGQQIENVATHPAFRTPVNNGAAGYDHFYKPGADAISEYLTAPRSVEALRTQMATDADMLTSTGYMSMMTLATAAGRISSRRPEGREAIQAYIQMLQREDLRLTECITDAKGDRNLAPGKQSDPDAYLRVVDRSGDGVVIRGAKLHIAMAAIGHELMVIPTKAMKPDEQSYAIACGVAVNTPGVKIINVGTPPQSDDLRDYPFSRKNFVSHGFVLFEDVFVPTERIFLDGETDMAATFAHSLGLWTRAQGVASMADEADTLVGFAVLIAEANGLEKTAHIREKISDMIIYATLLRAALEASLSNSIIDTDGVVSPEELYTNAGKYLGAAEHGLMVRHLHDIAGGSIQTAPSMKDLDNPLTGELIRKYMKTRPDVDGEYRLRLFQAIRDYTMTPYGVYKSVGHLLGGGGLYAQRVVTRGRYNIERAKRLAIEAADLTDVAPK